MPNYTTPVFFSKLADIAGGSFSVYVDSISFLTTESNTESDPTRIAYSPIIPQVSGRWAWSYTKGVFWIRPVAYAGYTISNLGVWLDAIPTGTMVMGYTAAYGSSPVFNLNPPNNYSNSSNNLGVTVFPLYPNYSTSTAIFGVSPTISSGSVVSQSSNYLLMALRVDSTANPGAWTATLYYTYTVN